MVDYEHVGRPIIRDSTRRGRVLVLCSRGHVLDSVRRKDWSGSVWPTRISDPNYTVTCHGKILTRLLDEKTDLV